MEALVRRRGRGLAGHVYGAQTHPLLDHGVIAQGRSRVKLGFNLAVGFRFNGVCEPAQIIVNGGALGSEMGDLPGPCGDRAGGQADGGHQGDEGKH